MKRRILSILLVLALVLSAFPAVGVYAADGTEDYIWAEMKQGLAVRYTINKAEVSRVEIGDVFQVEFWINAIDPYSMTIPLNWNPSIITMVNDETEQPVSSGKKNEADVGDGFRPGASCYDSSYGPDFLPRYWNGKPVYSNSSEENPEGYPYVDNQNGHCRFFYYVDAATPSAESQMYLQLTFKALKSGNPNFHFATKNDSVYDPASEDGMRIAYTDGGVQLASLEMPALNVIRDPSEETEVPVNPGANEPEITPNPSKPVTTETPTAPTATTTPTEPTTSARPTTPGGSNILQGNGMTGTIWDVETAAKGGTNNGGSTVVGSGTLGTAKVTGTSAPVGGIGTTEPTVRGPETEEPVEETDMVDTVHLDWYPYATPVYAQAVIHTDEDQVIRKRDNYILPESLLAEAINRVVNSNSSAIVVNMPNRIICKRNYEISFSCANLDDLVNRMDAMIYFETPAGFVGINPAALLSEVGDTAVVTFRVDPVRDGLRLKTKVDGKVVEGFTTPVYVLILPYGGSGQPKAVSSTEFGVMFRHLGQQPLPVSHYFEDKKAVSFLTPCAGTFQVKTQRNRKYTDLSKDYWAYDSITKLTRAGILGSAEPNAFVAEGKLNRAEVAKLVTCVFGTYQAQTDFTQQFEDVKLGDWYYPFVASASSVGLVNGVSEGVFDTEANVSHQDFAVMVYRGVQLFGLQLPSTSTAALADADEIDDYALEAMTALAKAGCFDGMPEGSFTPQGETTRAEAAQVLSVIYDLMQGLI